MQARLELLEKLHVYELGDRWLLAQRLLRDFSVQQHTQISMILCQLQGSQRWIQECCIS